MCFAVMLLFVVGSKLRVQMAPLLLLVLRTYAIGKGKERVILSVVGDTSQLA